MHAFFDLKTGPVAVLQSIKDCEEQLQKLETHKIAEQVDDMHAGRGRESATTLQVYEILVLAMLSLLYPQNGIVVLANSTLCCQNCTVDVANL